MFHAVVFNVTYAKAAFKVKAPWINHSTPSNLELDRAFECAQKAILNAGDGRRTIFKKSQNLRDGDKIQLQVLVPDDVDRYEQYLAVVNCFEAAVAIQLGVAVDTELRTVEDDNPTCVVCGQKADWIRKTQVSRTHYYCARHALQQDDFDKSDPSYFYWGELASTS